MQYPSPSLSLSLFLCMFLLIPLAPSRLFPNPNHLLLSSSFLVVGRSSASPSLSIVVVPPALGHCRLQFGQSPPPLIHCSATTRPLLATVRPITTAIRSGHCSAITIVQPPFIIVLFGQHSAVVGSLLSGLRLSALWTISPVGPPKLGPSGRCHCSAFTPSNHSNQPV